MSARQNIARNRNLFLPVIRGLCHTTQCYYIYVSKCFEFRRRRAGADKADKIRTAHPMPTDMPPLPSDVLISVGGGQSRRPDIYYLFLTFVCIPAKKRTCQVVDKAYMSTTRCYRVESPANDTKITLRFEAPYSA